MDKQYVDQVLPWVGRIERQFSILMREGLIPLNISYPEFRMVGMLWGEEAGLAQKDLASRLGLDASGVSVTLKGLEKKSHVERVRDADDARIVRVKCTPQAYKMESVLAVYQEQEEAAVSGLSASEKNQLLELLQKVSGNLSEKSGLL